MTATYEGRWGKAWELTVPDRTDLKAHIGAFFIHAPPAHPLWPHYLFSCVHLRDFPGQEKPAHKQFPDASHEFLLLALNPERGPWTHDNVVEKMLSGEGSFLTPANLVEQLHGATDDEALTLMHQAAKAMVMGVLPIELDDYLGARDYWRSTLWRTLEHIKTGGHPSEN